MQREAKRQRETASNIQKLQYILIYINIQREKIERDIREREKERKKERKKDIYIYIYIERERERENIQ
jgi:hypothetical protein